MKILISTGIFPPKIGGPSEYSKNLQNALEKAQNRVKIATFGLEEYLPTGLRHLWFLAKILPKVFWSDLVITMDTFSVALPTVVATKLLGKKNIIRTGGDFLWEQYVERTGKKVLFKNFYTEELKNLSFKEKIIFNVTKWTLLNSSFVTFSTEWQRQIFVKAYGLDLNKTSIIENYYGKKENEGLTNKFSFIGSTRKLVWKNLETLKKVFRDITAENTSVKLNLNNYPYEKFLNEIRNSYAVVLVSLGDISPNLILDSIRLNKPFICTKEVGIYERIKDVGIFVDPLNENEIREAVVRLLKPEEYEVAKEKVKNFSFEHSWDDIALEFIKISNKIK